jgi:hypothetical protein
MTGTSGMTRRQVLAAAGGMASGAAAAAVVGNTTSARSGPRPEEFDSEVPAAWFDLAAFLVRTTPGFSPPVASRAFGYAGVRATRRRCRSPSSSTHWRACCPDYGDSPTAWATSSGRWWSTPPSPS